MATIEIENLGVGGDLAENWSTVDLEDLACTEYSVRTEYLVGLENSIGSENSDGNRDPASIGGSVDIAAAADTPRDVPLLLAVAAAALLQESTALLTRLSIKLVNSLGGSSPSYLQRVSLLCSVNGSILALFEPNSPFCTIYSSPKIISISSLVDTKKSTGSCSFVPSG